MQATQRPGAQLLTDFQQVRAHSHRLCEPLMPEDYVVQSMPDASPTKWHLAHTSWFFEQFLLVGVTPNYVSPFPHYNFLFNSYYNAVGARTSRPKRGLLSRPSVEEVFAYRSYVDEKVEQWLNADPDLDGWRDIFVLGLHHEQQHQELIITDLKHMLAENPLDPVYRALPDTPAVDPGPARPVEFTGGLVWVGWAGKGFAFDNEGPRHRRFLQPFALNDRLVTNQEYLAFIQAGGYEQPNWWLSAGWATSTAQGWQAPLYWRKQGEEWGVRTLAGTLTLNPHQPVCHVSYYEADAYARWAGARLPCEGEWETAVQSLPLGGHFAEEGLFQPQPAQAAGGMRQMFGDVWEWTRSSYEPYPGFQPAAGALGEYNGKFMCNQYVLRGGSCATPASHIRATYRNFFPADARWQYSGIRLAYDRN
ncbi:ergothioneine biosynthesis protein EgtB [bacterium]|nr:ergothioneine biosynthesis protein EgtB [bacterium]